MKRILVINAKTWGDMVLSLPFLQHLRERYPDGEITLLTGRKGEAVMHCVGLNLRVLSWRTLTWRDVLSLRGEDIAYAISPGLFAAALSFVLGAKQRIGFHQATDAKWNGEYFQSRQIVPRWRAVAASILLNRSVIRNLDDRHESLRDFQLLPKDQQPAAEDLLRGLGLNTLSASVMAPRTAVLFPFSSASVKDWPIRRWRKLADRLLESKMIERIVVLGVSGHEGELSAAFCCLPQVEVLAGKLTIDAVFKTVRDADLVVANDSLGLHLASLYDRPAIGIFGPNPPKWYGAVSRLSRNLHVPLACSPCQQPQGRERCLRNHSTCPALRRIDVDQVFAAAHEILTLNAK